MAHVPDPTCSIYPVPSVHAPHSKQVNAQGIMIRQINGVLGNLHALKSARTRSSARILASLGVVLIGLRIATLRLCYRSGYQLL